MSFWDGCSLHLEQGYNFFETAPIRVNLNKPWLWSVLVCHDTTSENSTLPFTESDPTGNSSYCKTPQQNDERSTQPSTYGPHTGVSCGALPSGQVVITPWNYSSPEHEIYRWLGPLMFCHQWRGTHKSPVLFRGISYNSHWRKKTFLWWCKILVFL